MSFYNTGNPVPSIDPRDLDDNAKHIDEIANSTEDTYIDRLGAERLTMSGVNNLASTLLALPGDLANATDPSKGANLVAGTGKVVDPRDFGAHAITEPGFSTFDSTVAFDAAIQFALANNRPVVEFEGKYLINTALYTFELPHDDGTVYPPWVGAGDVNLAAEPLITMPVCLKINGQLILRGKNPDIDELTGSWDIDTGGIDTSQKIGILVTAGSKYSGTIRYRMEDFTLSKFMIGRVVEGIAENAYEALKYVRCGITGLTQGVERCTHGRTWANDCYAGEVIGGWWTQRNSTALETAYLPPYPAIDAYAIGWTDFHHTQELVYVQRMVAWGSRHIALDTFFDTYFYKSANSARTSAGGRLSNNDAPHPAIIYPYRGITGRARSVFTRYGRAMANIGLDLLKVLGPHRTPVYHSGGNAAGLSCSITEAYIERVGQVNPGLNTLTGNLFGIDNADPYRAANYGLGFNTAYGPLMGNLTVSAGVQAAAANDGANNSIFTPLTIVRWAAGSGSENASTIYLDCVQNGTSFDRRYRLNHTFAFMQPLRFGSESGPDFQYLEGAFTPAFNVAGTPVIAFTTIIGRYKRIGKIITGSVQFFRSAQVGFAAGPVTITGLPFTNGTLGSVGIQNVTAIGVTNLTAGITIGGSISGTTITLTKDSRGTPLDGADLAVAGNPTTITINFSYEMQ